MKSIVGAILLWFVGAACAQICPPEIQWQRSFGGTSSDFVYGLEALALPDGGFLLPGSSRSDPSGNKTAPRYGYDDFWLIRIDAQGNEIWQRSYGGSSVELYPRVAAMKGGRFLVAGISASTNDGNKTVPTNGDASSTDTWLLVTLFGRGPWAQLIQSGYILSIRLETAASS